MALQGWPYVTDHVIPTAAKPSVIEGELGIPGGSLRPLLKDLKDRHLLSYKDGSYSVRASSFDAISREIRGSHREVREPSAPTLKRSDADLERTSSEVGPPGIAAKRKRRSDSGHSREIGQRFRQWVDEGFFDDGRTLGEVQARFHDQAIIIPQTSIPKYLLAAVRDQRLTRSKEDINGKERWVYRSNR